MPKATSAERQARSSERRRIRNHAAQSAIRTGLARFATLLKTDPKSARAAGCQVVSLLDRAAKNRVMHHNAVRRYKARVMARIGTLPKS